MGDDLIALPLKVKNPKCGHRWRVNPDELIDPNWLKCPMCKDVGRNSEEGGQVRFSRNGRNNEVVNE